MRLPILIENDRLLFTLSDICQILRIKPSSVKVLLSRYVKNGYLIRIKRNLYILKNKIGNLSNEEKFIIANMV